MPAAVAAAAASRERTTEAAPVAAAVVPAVAGTTTETLRAVNEATTQPVKVAPTPTVTPAVTVRITTDQHLAMVQAVAPHLLVAPQAAEAEEAVLPVIMVPAERFTTDIVHVTAIQI